MEDGQYFKAIAIGGGGTRAERTPEEQATWLGRVRTVRSRAEATLLSLGAQPDDFGYPLGRSPTLHAALARLCEGLLPIQWQALLQWSRGTITGAAADVFEGLDTTGGYVRCFDEVVPVAEMVWP